MGEGIGRREFEVIRGTWNALTAPGKRSAERVARAGASGSAGVIAITFGHAPTICAVVTWTSSWAAHSRRRSVDGIGAG
jgi:hypothetical protein